MTIKYALKSYPVSCPSCDWFGTFDGPGMGSRCPVCECAVNPLQQKGLGNLRTHYRLLLKIGYKSDWTMEQRSIERERLERFFESIGKSL